MKADVQECGGGYWVKLQAETVKDAATLVRLKMNRAAGARARVDVYANDDGTVDGYIVLPRVSASKRTTLVQAPKR